MGNICDRDIEAILLACGTYRDIAEQLGFSFSQVQYIRGRKSRRAVNAARRLGLPFPTTRTCFTSDGAVVVRHVDDVAAGAAHLPYAR